MRSVLQPSLFLLLFLVCPLVSRAQAAMHIDSLIKQKGQLVFQLKGYELEGRNKLEKPEVKSTIILTPDSIIFAGTSLWGNRTKREAFKHTSFQLIRYEEVDEEMKAKDPAIDSYYKGYFRYEKGEGGTFEMYIHYFPTKKEYSFLLWHTVAATLFHTVPVTK